MRAITVLCLTIFINACASQREPSNVYVSETIQKVYCSQTSQPDDIEAKPESCVFPKEEEKNDYVQVFGFLIEASVVLAIVLVML